MKLSLKCCSRSILILVFVHIVRPQSIKENVSLNNDQNTFIRLKEADSISVDKNNEELSLTDNKNNTPELEDDSQIDKQDQSTKTSKELLSVQTLNSPEVATDLVKKEENSMETIHKDCKDSLACAEEKLVSLIDTFDSKRSRPLFLDLVSLEKTSQNDEVPKKDTKEGLISRIGRYLKSHCVRVHNTGTDDESDGIGGPRSFDLSLDIFSPTNASEGRGRLKKIILPLILLAKIIFATLLPIFLSVIALISVKGLWAGLAAMLVSGVVGLKALLSNEDNNKASTRVTLVKPHIVPDVYHGDYLHGWSRSGHQDPYRGYLPISSSWDRPVKR